MAHATGKPKEHVRVPLTADVAHLTETDKKILHLLVETIPLINKVYLDQRRQNFYQTKGVFDKRRSANFYPTDASTDEVRKQIDAYLMSYPAERKMLLSPFTNVIRYGNGFRAVPYSSEYRREFVQIGTLLRKAARLAKAYPKFKKFLQSKARAFLINSYTNSDIDWISANDSPFELVIGPYESYEDKLYGVKRDVEGVLSIARSEETRQAELFQGEILNFDAHLGKRYGYTTETTLTPMIVADMVAAGGGPIYEYVPMACNLPNDPEILARVGSKKVFYLNVIRAKMERITSWVATAVLERELRDCIEPSIFFLFVLGHESAHGLSFRFTGNDFGPSGALLEEAKADIFGLLFLYYLADRGVLTKEMAQTAVLSHLTDGLRQLRFGLGEAHAAGTLLQYNHFFESEALRIKGTKFLFAQERFRETLEELGDKFYALSQTKNPEKIEEFINARKEVPTELRTLINSLEGIPVDIDPIFSM